MLWLKKTIKRLFIAVFAVSLTVFGFYAYLMHWSLTGGPNEREVEIVIERGSTAHQIGRDLKQAGVISSPFVFYLYLRLMTRASEKLQSGDYMVKAHTTPKRIVHMLEHGLQREYRFTIPEGSDLKDIVDIISRSGIASREALEDAAVNPLLREEFRVPGDLRGGIEGYLYPDTYVFQAGTLPKTIFRNMHEELIESITPAMWQRMQARDLDLNEVLTMASLIEKETNASKERPIIASVFFNRLKKGMKLQTDPSVVYGMERFKGRITHRHLKRDHEYNTYLYKGLPPGPIASPGLAAIKAVLWPAKTDYLFFVSRKNGTHEFCPTYNCHVNAINKFHKNGKPVSNGKFKAAPKNMKPVP